MNRQIERKRLIVVHECRPGYITPGLFFSGDTVFFDDCLYSQYDFFMRNCNLMQDITVIFGFSPGLSRTDGLPPIQFMESAQAHRAVNAKMRVWTDTPPDEIRAFMSLAEL